MGSNGMEANTEVNNLYGKVALVTGASRGIGRAIALKLASLGATVIVNYNGSRDKAQDTCDEIQKCGGTAEISGFDVADAEAVQSSISELLSRHGHIDILVNNAGITRDSLLMGMKVEDIDDVLSINLKSAFLTIKSLSRNFLKLKYGKIINISSVSGVMGNPGQANYSASKAGLIGLTKSVAREYAGRGICVNAVAPGFIDTDMVKKMGEDARDKIADAIPMKKIGRPEDVAELVAFLAGSASDYITGQVICVDGGMAM